MLADAFAAERLRLAKARGLLFWGFLLRFVLFGLIVFFGRLFFLLSRLLFFDCSLFSLFRLEFRFFAAAFRPLCSRLRLFDSLHLTLFTFFLFFNLLLHWCTNFVRVGVDLIRRMLANVINSDIIGLVSKCCVTPSSLVKLRICVGLAVTVLVVRTILHVV